MKNFARGQDTATIARYERCPACIDGSCRACGQASTEHAGAGVRLVIRRIRFVPCDCEVGCGKCGPNIHGQAAPGVTIEVIDEHSTKRWVPSVHLRAAGKENASVCGSGWSGALFSDDRAEVTCRRCLKWMK